MIFNLNIAQTLTLLLRQEDTNSDKKITIDDIGPKVFSITSISGQNYKVKGTYFLSNLLQELVLSKRNGNEFAQVPLERIEELPTVRISRLIKDYYWLGLTRTMDKQGIQKLLLDTKNNSLNS